MDTPLDIPVKLLLYSTHIPTSKSSDGETLHEKQQKW